MKNLDKLSLSDLISLYNNYMLVNCSSTSIGTAFSILDNDEVKEIRNEIDKRIDKYRI